MFTADTIARLSDYATPTYSWHRSPITTSRPVGTAAKPVRQGLQAFLWAFSGGTCAFCGEDNLKDGAEVCHVVSGGGNNVRAGYIAGNLAMGCYGCNALDKERGPVVAYETIARPDLIPTEWPDRATLIALGTAVVARGERPWTTTGRPSGRALDRLIIASEDARPL